MTDEEAQREAERRWGANAIANRTAKLLTLGVLVGPNLVESYGWGDTWAEAFTLAEERKHLRGTTAPIQLELWSTP